MRGIVRAYGAAFVSLCLLLAAVVFSARAGTESAIVSVEVFARDYRQTRAESIRQLDQMCQDAALDAEIRADAARMKLSILAWTEQEAALAAILSTRGYGACVVTVRKGSVNVLVPAASVASADAAVILDAVLRETGQGAENVKIIPIGDPTRPPS